MSEEKLYAVKNDKGVWLSLDSSHESVWYTNNPTFFKDRICAEDQIIGRKAHIVTLIEEPEKVVLSKKQAKIVEKAHKAIWPATYISGLKDSSEQRLLMKAYVNGYTVAKEKRYMVELDGLVTTDGAKQYLTNKDGKWFASRIKPSLHQAFTGEELNNAPEWVKQLNREEVTDDEQ
ncbi:DUF1642 domain-containing protein [Lapidilactobacillus luobeiensis]|uniref:DUF1642 domain-containing protein n=1 Tax=Lapidilactobacillus luobeiensis TaxID=2950371 RepID=UPI0021C28A3E|nr:DUF1642 domain-containing protein [Lapidilactobacillus luobeiensis]